MQCHIPEDQNPQLAFPFTMTSVTAAMCCSWLPVQQLLQTPSRSAKYGDKTE